MKKESLSVMTAKTLLAVLLFAGIGTIIIGGGYIVGEYQKDKSNKTLLTLCKNNFDCPLQMKCENFICVDVGCIKEGGSFPPPISPKYTNHMATECCKGLKAITFPGGYDENCNRKLLYVGAPTEMCSNCGNGICEENLETKCNCPEDCEEKDEIANWKTYRNELIGIEFKYPYDWSTLYPDDRGDIMKDGKSYTSFSLHLRDLSHLDHTFLNYDNMLINEQYEKIKCQSDDMLIVECENRVSNNNVKYVWKIEKTKGGHHYEALVATGKYVLIFNFQEKENYNKRASEYQKLLSTLKIIEDGKTDTSDWQTYQNEEFGFEIDYKSFNSKVCRKPFADDSEPMFCLVDKNDEIVPYSDFRISVLQNLEEFSAKEFAENRKKIALSLGHSWHSGANMTEQEIQVNGYDVYLYNNVFGGDCGMKKYYIVHKNKAIMISFTGSTPKLNYDNMEYNLEIFNQMLSTFKFVEN